MKYLYGFSSEVLNFIKVKLFFYFIIYLLLFFYYLFIFFAKCRAA